MHQLVFLMSLSLFSHVPASNGAVSLAAFPAIPARPQYAMSGSQFAEKTASMSGKEREKVALEELRKGNVPSFLRRLKPVELTYKDDGETVTAVIQVAPDYLAIGSDEDFLRIPLSYPAAVSIASRFGCILPTRKIVDEIYFQSFFHYKPQPMRPGPMMRSTAYYLEHQRKIENQRAGRPLGKLASGHKKDVVLTNNLWEKPGRVAIYGWHKPDGEPIQGLSTFHGARYADYSHGVRLISQAVLINGEYRSILDVLENPSLAPAFTYERVITNVRGLIAMKNTNKP